MYCSIYKTRREAELYIYVPFDVGLKKVPEQLLARFPEPQKVIDLKLDQHRKLARVDVNKVIAALSDQGYYLQLPPAETGFSGAADC